MRSNQENSDIPLVGVFVSKNQIPRLLKQKAHPRIVALVHANFHAKTTLYFFSLKNVQIGHQTIDGMYYDYKECYWKRATFPYPSILYKRGEHKNSSGKKYTTFLAQLASLGTKRINYLQGFNKWILYHKLNMYEEIKDHLPETRRLTSVNVLKEMLRITNKLYVKASRGSRGKQVLRIVYEDSTYKYSYYNGRIFSNRTGSPETLYKHIQKFFTNKEIIIQKAIDLVEVDGSIIDLRAEIQRDGNGNLDIVGIPVRMSQKNAPITTHANSFTFEYFFKTFLSYTNEDIAILKNKVETLATNIYQCIEKNEGHVGELGIDLALDKDGKLWYIEANSQSAKVSLFKAYSREINSKAYLNPLEYAKYLFNQNKIPPSTN